MRLFRDLCEPMSYVLHHLQKKNLFEVNVEGLVNVSN